MLRAVAFLVAFVPVVVSAQQQYAGTWTMSGSNGPVTLVLQAPGADRMVRGTLSGNGMDFRVETEVQADRIIGYALSPDGSSGVYFEAMPEGAGLRVLFADIDANGAPVASTAQQFVFSRASAVAQQAPSPSRPAPAPAQPSGGGGVAGIGPHDAQIVQLLTSSPWCHFSYSGTSTGSGGTTRQERNVFRQDGTVLVQSSSESSYSARANDQYGNELARGGTTGSQQQGEVYRWRVDNAQLMLSADGAQWAPMALQFSQNSNGYPIITANGREYSQCN